MIGSAALQEYRNRDADRLVDTFVTTFVAGCRRQPAQLLVPDQHVVEQDREAMWIEVAADVAAALLQRDPARDDLIGRARAGIVE